MTGRQQDAFVHMEFRWWDPLGSACNFAYALLYALFDIADAIRENTQALKERKG